MPVGNTTYNNGDNENVEDVTMKPPAINSSPSWPCANCQTAVSTERCPRCHGIQVRVVVDHHTQKDYLPKAWLERLSPALMALRTPTQTPTRQLDITNDNDVDEDDQDEEEDGLFRPVDPVAYILGSAPSPIVDSQQTVFKLKEIEDGLRLRKRPLITSVAAELPDSNKKAKWLSAV